jgi:hypothetical protein
MRSIRNLKCLVAVMSMALLAAAGCSKDKKESETAGDGVTKGADKGAVQGRFTNLPADSNLVIGVNVEQIRSSKLFKDVAEPILRQQTGGDYEKLKAACGFDPIDQVKSVTIGGNTGQNDKVAVQVKGISATQLKGCGEAIAKSEGEDLQLSQEGNLTKVVSSGQESWFGWLDENTMVTAGNDKALLETVLANKEGLSRAELREMIGKVDTDAALWLAFRDLGDPGSSLAAAPVQFQAAYGSISLREGLLVNAALRQSSPEEAQKTVADFTAQLEQFKQSPYGKYVSKLELKTSGSDVLMKLTLSDAELQELMNDPSIKALAAMMGMGAMGGM